MPDPYLDDLAAFVVASPSSFHAAATVAARLDEAGFVGHDERDPIEGTPGGHYVVRDGAIVAWRVPSSPDPSTLAFRMGGAHTDSPGLRLKPNPTTGAFGYQQVAVEVYGGPLPNQWLDRELGIAGRVVSTDGTPHLVATPPWLRVPQVAPHLDRAGAETLKLDRQAHLKPLFAVGQPELDLLALIADEAGLEPEEVAGHDLICFPTEAPTIFGATGDFFASPRLDNLSSIHAGMTALLAAGDPAEVTVLACFDHEEVGSASRSGAGGPLLADILTRIARGIGADDDGFRRALARSSCISADAGYAIHPNYAGLHDPDHRPVLGGGPLLKHNANLRYTTDGASTALWLRACAEAGVPTQHFVSNNSVACGSTIGPMTAARLGVLMCDVGLPLLSMHSTREMAGAADPGRLAAALTAYYAGG